MRGAVDRNEIAYRGIGSQEKAGGKLPSLVQRKRHLQNSVMGSMTIKTEKPFPTGELFYLLPVVKKLYVEFSGKVAQDELTPGFDGIGVVAGAAGGMGGQALRPKPKSQDALVNVVFDLDQVVGTRTAGNRNIHIEQRRNIHFLFAGEKGRRECNLEIIAALFVDILL